MRNNLVRVLTVFAIVAGRCAQAGGARAQGLDPSQGIATAAKAADWYLTQGVLGVTCLVLLAAVGFLFWKLDRLSTSIMREVVTALQANTAATVAGNLTITALTTTLNATDDGVEKLSHQTELAAQAAASRAAEIMENQKEIKRRLEGRTL